MPYILALDSNWNSIFMMNVSYELGYLSARAFRQKLISFRIAGSHAGAHLAQHNKIWKIRGIASGSRDTLSFTAIIKGHFISSIHFIKSFVSRRFSRHARVHGHENRTRVRDLSRRTCPRTHTRSSRRSCDLLLPSPLLTPPASRIGLFIIGLGVDLVSKFYAVPTGFFFYDLPPPLPLLRPNRFSPPYMDRFFSSAPQS